jgi:Zn2+/Cd2+-exporting ATPase
LNASIEKQTYRVQGFTCINCAGKFEENVKQLDGVIDAKVNFGAAKITVYGNTTIEKLEEAGAFENLKIYPEKKIDAIKKESIWRQYSKVFISSIFIFIGYIGYFTIGENHWLTILAFAAAILLGGYTLFKTGLKNLTHLDFDMKTLMTIAIIGAVIIEEWAEGAVVVVLFAISEGLEAYSMNKARASIQSLMELAPNEATIKRDNKEVVVNVEDIKIGDLLIIKPGEKIAMDGIVVSGKSTVNQATITGESQPVFKQINDEVYAGTVNEEGYLEVKVTKTAEDTTLAKIIHLVEEAQAERAPSQAFVDKFAKYYTPVIIGIAVLVALIPPLFFQQPWGEWIYQGLAILVVGCPCALVVSTPVAIVTAIGAAAKQGVLIKGGIYLEEMAKVKAIAFDKTGTLTYGKPKVTDVKWLIHEQIPLHLAIIHRLESYSQHPLGKAMKDYVLSLLIDNEVLITDFTSITGKGVKGTVDQKEYWIGNEKLAVEVLQHPLSNETVNIIGTLQNEGKTAVLYGDYERIIAIFAVRDEPRSECKNVMAEISSQGIDQTVMLTGDNVQTARSIGKEVGIPFIKGNLLPDEKLAAIQMFKDKYGKVAMVGDGINDAPALAMSTVGIAMGGAGTDTALETADLALMSDDLTKLPYILGLSKKALTIIKQNIAFSFIVKIIALLLVVPNWLTLWIAIFADMGATLIVTLNGLRLLKYSN